VSLDILGKVLADCLIVCTALSVLLFGIYLSKQKRGILAWMLLVPIILTTLSLLVYWCYDMG